jgi:hypothetical protein
MTIARKAVFMIAVLALATTFGCDDDSSSSSETPGNDLSPQETMFLSFEDALDGIHDMTFEHPMTFAPDFREGRPRGHGPRARPILRWLGLDRDQRMLFRDAMIAGRDCTRPVLDEMREANQDVLADANEQRMAILQAYDDGEITREEAEVQIRELSQATREAIRNDPENAQFKDAICLCRSETIDAIRAILDTEQQGVWDSWVAGHSPGC